MFKCCKPCETGMKKSNDNKNNKKNNLYLTLCGAPSRRKIVPNCVANGIVLAKAYVGARVGIGYIDVQSSGSVSTRYCTRNIFLYIKLANVAAFSSLKEVLYATSHETSQKHVASAKCM
uniref:Uncharacterized protein n=1 Tax=Glossina austeni TaxID=7395 RepID=A0A1A9UP68_GLOAU